VVDGTEFPSLKKVLLTPSFGGITFVKTFTLDLVNAYKIQ
jgi:hypothetical protein